MNAKISEIKNNISEKKITVFGAGISGLGASYLANYLNAEVFLSDIKYIDESITKDLDQNNIKYEFEQHSNKCLDSDLVIVSPGINIKKNIIFKKINNNNIPIISEIEFASWFTNYPIIAITGSNGKSTVVKLLYEIFLKKYPNTLLGGNIGKSFSENILNEIKNNKKDIIHILEISSFQLENIYTFNPKVACIINITCDHLDRYKNIEDYFNTKLNITRNFKQGSYIVYDDKNKKLHEYYKNFKNSFGLSSLNETKYILSKNTNLAGEHNIDNIRACIIIAKIFDIEKNDLKKALTDFKSLEHRLENFKKINGITFINDSKGTNVYSTKAAINSFDNNIILILGGSKGIIEEELLDIINTNSIRYIICYGEVGDDLYLSLKKIKPIMFFKLFQDAILESIKIATKGDIILLSPAFKSYDQFKNFEQRGKAFKKIVNKYYA